MLLLGIRDEDARTTIPDVVKRHGMDQRKGCEKTVTDICAALTRLDAEDKMPCFSVDFTDLARIPAIQSTEVMQKEILLERVARLEGRVEAMENAPQRTHPSSPHAPSTS